MKTFRQFLKGRITESVFQTSQSPAIVLNDDEARIVRRGMIGRMKQDPKLSDAFKDHVSNKTEIEFKHYFAKYLMDQGYTAVEWKEPVRGVQQILVLDPKSIKVIKPKSDMAL